MNKDLKVQRPIVKVCMITYNHEKYLEEAINSILNQEAPFSIELVIGEDQSTDKTRSICEHFASTYPDKINLLPSDKKYGIQGNAFRTHDACIGADYVAFCEGDDKWIDNNKLFHQVDFLEKNKAYLAHAHNVIRHDLRNNVDSNFGEVVDKVCSKEELFNEWPFHTVSLVVRGNLLQTIPVDKLPRFISGDRFINRWISCHGDLYYEGSKFMAVYNRHTTGASENSNYLDLRYQELAMLDFFEGYPNINELRINAKIYAIRDIALFWAERYGKKVHSKIKLALDYIKLTSLNLAGAVR